MSTDRPDNSRPVATGSVPERTPSRLGRLSALFGRTIIKAVIFITVVFLIGPVIITFVASFAREWTGLLPSGFVTLINWKQALGIAETLGAQRGLGGAWEIVIPGVGIVIPVPVALGFSMLLALGGVFINLLVGIPIAYAVTRYDFYGRGWMNTFAVLPIVPGIILGIAFLKTYPDLPSVIALVL
ncbi:MAG: ABC transporter permease, partial [Halobacteriales archaeon]